MKSKTLYIGLAVVAIGLLVVGIAVFTSGDDLLEKPEVSDQEQAANGSVVDEETLRENHDGNVTVVITSEDKLLGQYEKSDRLFKRTEVGNWISYRHPPHPPRMIDGAIVEKDRRVYIFDRNTKELLEKNIHWRDDLPEHLPSIITREEAESMVGGKIMYTDLWYISPDSDIFPIKPTPENPCWAVWIADDRGYNTDVIIIDAVEGKILGYGVPIP